MTKKLKRKYIDGGVNPEVKPQGIKNISPLDVPPTIDPNTLHYLQGIQQGVIHKNNEKYQSRWRNPFENIKDGNLLEDLGIAGVGLDYILNQHDKQLNDQNYARRMRNTFTQKPLYDYNNLWGPDSNGGAEYQPLIMAEHGAEIRKPSGKGNVHLDNGELVQLPDLSTEYIKGGPEGTDSFVTDLPQGARVFSDTLKPKGEKRTYSQLAKKYDTAKYKKILETPYSPEIDRNTAELMMNRHQGALDALFQDQQAQNGNSDGTRFKDGGVYGKDGLENDPITKTNRVNNLHPYISKGARDRTPSGQDNSSKLTKEQWAEQLSALGYDGPLEDKDVQNFLLKNYPDIVTQRHKDYGDPLAKGTTPEKWVDGMLGARWEGALADAVASKAQPTAPKAGETDKKSPTAPVTPTTDNFEGVLPWEQTMSTMGKFPLYQAAPEALGYLSALSPYSYYTPDFTHTEVVPPTLNIQPQLNSINSSFQSGIRQNTGNASVNNSRNVAMFNQALEAKQQAFGNKQNYDANARFQADQYNANARTKENQDDLTAAATVHNEYRAAALDNATTERLNAAFSLTDKVGRHYQDEYKKMLYFDTVIPDFYYTGDPSHPIKQDPNSKQKFYSKYPKYK